MTAAPRWWIFHDIGVAPQRLRRFPDPPPWRRFDHPVADPEPADYLPLPISDAYERVLRRKLGTRDPAEPLGRTPTELNLINAALLLRRPMLVTGPPGIGKSTLAYSIARELGLGEVLVWPITSRTTLADGLYHYDAIGRLQEVSVDMAEAARTRQAPADGQPAAEHAQRGAVSAADIGRFIRLGPLGTALLPGDRPRVLLIDEIDKSDVDLTNDLLNVFEDGRYRINELARIADPQPVRVLPHNHFEPVWISGGEVHCAHFPVVVMTSNGERSFPGPLLRRCVRIALRPPKDGRLFKQVLTRHLGDPHPTAEPDATPAIENTAGIAADQWLNVAYLTRQFGAEVRDIAHELLKPLNGFNS